MSFNIISGQSKAISELKQFIKSERIPSCLIFYGEKGIGKRMAALEFAKSLNCLEEKFRNNADNCGMCENCNHINGNTHPDIVIADFNYQSNLLREDIEKQQHIKVETIRDICKKAQQKTQMNGWKVIIIDEAQTMLREAQNAMLKFIEEPAPQTVWILISDKKFSLLNTIISRSQSISFAPLDEKIVKDILMKNEISEHEAELAAKYANGSTARAFKILDIIEDIENIDKNSPTFAFDISDNLSRNLADARQEAHILMEILLADIQHQWKEESEEKRKSNLTKLINQISDYKKTIARNVSPSLLTETAFLEAEKHKVKILENV